MPDPVVPPAPPATFDVNTLTGDAWMGVLRSNDKFKENPVALNTKSPFDALEQLVNAQGLIGKNRLVAPEPTWTDKEWDNLHSTLGRPATPKDYKLPKVEGFELDETTLNAVNEHAHKAGLTQRQYEKMLEQNLTFAKQQSQAEESARLAQVTAAENAMRQKYGAEYEPLVNKANALINQLGSAELSEYLKSSGLGNNPHFIDFAIGLAKSFADDSAIGTGLNNNLSPENKAVQEIANLKADQSFTKQLFDETDPNHRNAVAKWHDLHKKAYPAR